MKQVYEAFIGTSGLLRTASFLRAHAGRIRLGGGEIIDATTARKPEIPKRTLHIEGRIHERM
jgi:hypothetical protein